MSNFGAEFYDSHSAPLSHGNFLNAEFRNLSATKCIMIQGLVYVQKTSDLDTALKEHTTFYQSSLVFSVIRKNVFKIVSFFFYSLFTVVSKEKRSRMGTTTILLVLW